MALSGGLLLLAGIFASAGIPSLCAQGCPGVSPCRIVSTAPSSTEMLFSLGAGDRVVGVTTYCKVPAEAQTRTLIGDFATPDVEKILRLRPDLIVILAGRTDLEEKFRSLSLPTYALESESVEEILESIERLAVRLSIPARGKTKVAEIRAQVERVRQRWAAAPRPKVLFLVGRNRGALGDIYAVGGNSYLGELLELAGGSNVFSDSPAAYPKVSVEEIIARDPEVIIDMSHGELAPASHETPVPEPWNQLPSINAVRSGRVVQTPEGPFLVPGPRLGEAVERLAAIIHGDLQGE